MITEFIMEIGYIFKDGDKGKKIIGGADQKYPMNDLSWLNFIHKTILIRTKKGDFLFKVKNIDIFPSISDALNIGLTLHDDLAFDLIDVGDKVYKISDIDHIE